MEAEKKKEKRQAARDRIREAALNFLGENSADALSMRSIAKVMGVSPMMPYHYYPTKAELLSDIRRMIFEHFAQYLNECATVGSMNAAERFELISFGYLKYAADAESDFRFMFEQGIEEEGAEGVSGEKSWNILLQAVSDLVHEEKVQNIREDVINDKAHYCWCALHGLVMLYLSKNLGFGRSYKTLSQKIVDANLKAVAEQEISHRMGNQALPPVHALLKSRADVNAPTTR